MGIGLEHRDVIAAQRGAKRLQLVGIGPGHRQPRPLRRQAVEIRRLCLPAVRRQRVGAQRVDRHEQDVAVVRLSQFIAAGTREPPRAGGDQHHEGGGAGRPGRFLVNGQPVSDAKKIAMNPEPLCAEARTCTQLAAFSIIKANHLGLSGHSIKHQIGARAHSVAVS